MATDGEEMRLRVRKKVVGQLYDELYRDDQGTSADYDDDERKKLRGPKKKESPYSIQNFCWILAAVAVAYYTDFFYTLWSNTRIRTTWFYTGAALISMNISIAGFLIVYLSYIKKVHSDLWEQHYPAAIPIATACFAFGSFCVTVGLWPVWSFLTPFILFTIFMGVVVTVAMLPAF